MEKSRLFPSVLLVLLLTASTGVSDIARTSQLLASSTKKPSFVNPASLDIERILPPPPLPNTQEAKIDNSYIRYAAAAATDNQILLGIAASRDSVFDYSQTLGIWFSPKVLPKTAALFSKVTEDTKIAIELAKNHFKRARPATWRQTGDTETSDGYCYPSGHTTRAYVWANLLANALPDEKKALHHQARQKAWYRVSLGRHYPSDVRAGKNYGAFLASQFLNNQEFQREWPAVCDEIRNARAEAMPPPSFKL